MELEELLVQSLQLLGLGMGAVFIILVLLIAVISVVAKLVPEEVTSAPVVRSPVIDNGHIAAITAAVHLYKKNR